MNELEKYIRNKRDEFDDSLPADGHFERFQEKLEVKAKRKFLIHFQLAAAIIIGIIITGVSIYSIGFSNTENKPYATFDQEIKETIYFYSQQNIEMEQKINSLNFSSESEKDEIFKDIKSYDKNIDKINEDLKIFPSNERVRSALIEHHKGKTELLEFIIAQVNINTI